MSGVVLTAGAVLRADDAAGPLLAKRCETDPVEGWEVIDGGQTPEDDLGYIKRVRPDRIVVVDAADMGLPVGEVRRLESADVVSKTMFMTHSLPLSILVDELARCCPDVLFLGVQPGTLEFFGPMSPAVERAVEGMRDWLVAGADPEAYDRLRPRGR